MDDEPLKYLAGKDPHPPKRERKSIVRRTRKTKATSFLIPDDEKALLKEVCEKLEAETGRHISEARVIRALIKEAHSMSLEKLIKRVKDVF